MLTTAGVGLLLARCGTAPPAPSPSRYSVSWTIDGQPASARTCPPSTYVEVENIPGKRSLVLCDVGSAGVSFVNQPGARSTFTAVLRDQAGQVHYARPVVREIRAPWYPPYVFDFRLCPTGPYRPDSGMGCDDDPPDGGAPDASLDAPVAIDQPTAPTDTAVDALVDAPTAMDGGPPDVATRDAPAPVDVPARDRGDVPACPRSGLYCDGACRDVSADPNHCGDCGVVCPAGRTCVYGECRVPCNAMGTCDDPSLTCLATFPRYCDRAECARTGASCGGVCADVFADRANCAWCGNVCPAGTDCIGGTACGTCPPPLTWCGGECVDLQTRFQHCGACGNTCPMGGRCSAGVCGCQTGRTLCGSACAELATDRSHCGACGRACGATERCVSGSCVSACASGQTACMTTATEPVCVDTESNASHCGRCNNPCGAGRTCVRGVCTP